MRNEELIKQVYASFGLAYYMSECVYRGLIQVLAVAGPCLSRPRVEERFKVLEEKTMGSLIAEVKTIAPPDLHSALDWALERRNFLAHCFWFESLQQLAHNEGMKHLVFELMSDVEKFKHLGRALDYIAFTKLGVEQDTLQQCIEQTKQTPLEPLPARLVPKTNSKLELRRAWEVPTSSGNALIFQDHQGLFWQLCDIGLGWSYLDGPNDDWHLCELINKYLPAKVIARPAAAQCWKFALDFSTRIRLVVWWPRDKDCFRWKLEERDSAQVNSE